MRNLLNNFTDFCKKFIQKYPMILVSVTLTIIYIIIQLFFPSIAKMIDKINPLIPKGIRTNNPMNIRKTDTFWQGEVEGSNKNFESFKTMQYGIRAGLKNLLTYSEKHKLQSLKEIITRWAPPTENKTETYIDTVFKELCHEVPTLTVGKMFTKDSDFFTPNSELMPYLGWSMSGVEVGKKERPKLSEFVNEWNKLKNV